MMRILFHDEQGNIATDLQTSQLALALENNANFIWLDLGKNETGTVEQLLNEVFGFHPLAIDDALHETHIPKVDDWQDYLYIVMRATSLEANGMRELRIPELDFFLGHNFLVTHSREPIAAIDRVWKLCNEDRRRLNRGPDYLLYQIADELVSDTVSVVEQMGAELDLIEERIFGKARPEVLEDIFGLKRSILKLRRIMVPQRDVLNKLSRNEYQTIDAPDRIFFRDVFDHLLQLNDLLEEMLILIGSALDTYLSVVNNRMNNIMKTLTIITAFFMPLAFITGFFGMNFFQPTIALNPWTSLTAFILVLTLSILSPVIMFLWMRQHDWI